MNLPPLRHLDAAPIEHEGRQYICLHDPSGIVEEQLILSPHAFFVAACLTGETTAADIQTAFREQSGGGEIAEEEIREVVEYLDEQGFLFTEAFEARRQAVESAFASAAARPAYLAGRSYPDNASELRTFLDGKFLHDGGPGELPKGAPGQNGSLSCLIVPHIDFHRGGHTYAHGYLALHRAGKPDVVFIFGVAHVAQPVPFILTKKDFETPLGVMETDQEIVSKLEGACSWDPYAYELVHRTEHSVEFQAVMLAHAFGTDVKIVPILCSTFSDDPDCAEPGNEKPVADFLAACNAVAKEHEGKVLAVASADLAHVGRRFGDDFDIDHEIVLAVHARDHEDMAFAVKGDADGFYRSVMKDLNNRKVCGLNCIYAALKTVEGQCGPGELVHYDYAPDPAGGIVSFANVNYR